MSESNRIEAPDSDYEKRDVSLQVIAIFGAGLIVLTIVVLLLMRLMFNALEATRERSEVPLAPLANTRQPPSGPLLQVNPAQELNEMRAREDALLNSYRWVNEEAGIVRIPINRAIELLAEKGLTARKQGDKKEKGEQEEEEKENKRE